MGVVGAAGYGHRVTSSRVEPAPTRLPVPRDWAAIAAVGVTLVLWASAFVAIRHLGEDFGAGSLALGRCLVGAVLLGLAQTYPRAFFSNSGVGEFVTFALVIATLAFLFRPGARRIRLA